ncbi:MAG: SMR family transporter [Bacteroidota bacterium]
MKFTDLKIIDWQNLLQNQINHRIVLPFLGYFVFGFGNIYFFSLALKKIPTSSAFAIWTVLIIILLKITDVFLFKNKIQFAEVFFLCMITVGIIGLKHLSGN